jgi:hypothetical protein
LVDCHVDEEHGAEEPVRAWYQPHSGHELIDRVQDRVSLLIGLAIGRRHGMGRSRPRQAGVVAVVKDESAKRR